MTVFLDSLSIICLALGCFLGITGGIGIYRLPDFFTRLHASSVTDSACAFLILFGLALQAGWSLITVKLGLVFFFLVLSSPTASHALAKTALNNNQQPLLGRKDKR
ncbi:monovalent cation/H(+) antiporter subunit G [Desulfuromonas acetoxidans]|uniref:Na+/H+ antiporter subunit n=1 Tax=Desulfuromonas acetoxidans (strain DSM 684 / 11070) TaxID=281689 RepID=Q1K3V9_DESA6|nr:monovalent cation/H(+) antiporter subunit G [Desulfuromonas acetoxidans]EAT17344.1 Na+/H+ antiporter subunit [Desulfuromonas acetoxidans DSM 684]MBF0644273.1 monovalent cation/H(+) antiporter subunit G [Desulfuromonas acetoxidans]NVD24857.1 monovalent cation/H(+) antiporter subunit G [Desulfuromonas acetoxidans]NVE15158.1 monovalent cation/H(+) antiporter subunit G [Desulfuromonas acetoxidans]